MAVCSYEDCIAMFPGVSNVKAQYFGSYQGQFLCSFEKDGEMWFLWDYYGSCSGCDSFEAEFGYRDDVTDEKVVEFARSYVESACPKGQLVARLEKEPLYLHEAQEALVALKTWG